MGYLDCMARVMIAHISGIIHFDNPYIDKLTAGTTKAEVTDCLENPKIQGIRYQYVTEVLLERDAAANDVLDLSLAIMLFPQFGAALRKETGAEATVKNGYLAEKNKAADYKEMKRTYELLCRAFLVDREKEPFFENPFYIDNRLYGFLGGEDEIDWKIRNWAKLYLPDTKKRPLQTGVSDAMQMQQLAASFKDGKNIWLLNGDMQESQEILKIAAKNSEEPLIFVDIDAAEGAEIQKNIALAVREAFFYQAYVCIFLQKEENGTAGRLFIEELERQDIPYCICGKQNMELFYSIEQYISIIEFPDIRRYDRIYLWNTILEELELSIDASSYARKYSFNRAKMGKIFSQLTDYKEQGIPLTEEVVEDLCKRVSYIEAEKGELIAPNPEISIDKLVLSADKKEILYKICNHEWYRDQVLREWGMEKQYIYGNGTAALFTGPPGTGKTMAAYVISNMLGLPLYKIDLSQIADKYIGETEKHLEKVFHYAQSNHVILFFDEADAIFGKRSEVKDAKDRYANNEVSYILQRIEQYDGIVLLTTNLKNNIDSAFMRRMKYVIHFAMPDEKERLAIWEKGFPKELPVGEIDLEFLARQFELSGGNIKNIILTAAFDAAGEKVPIGMKHLLTAVRYEYAKYNKIMTPQEFGEYEPMMSEN